MTRAEIKFRGKLKSTGEYIYGDFTHSLSDEKVYIAWEEAEPESVAQLVGYDAEGAEVYEGDALITRESDEGKAFKIYAAIHKFTTTEPTLQADFTKFAKEYEWKLAKEE